MALTGLWEATVAAGAIGLVFFIIFAKIVKNNPKVGEWVAQFNPGKLYEKVPIIPDAKDKMERVYQERMI